MKFAFPLIVFLCGTILFIIGALCKITHFHFIISANLMLFLASIIQIIGVIIFIFKLIIHNKKTLL
ncbi:MULTISPECIES: hypothetical protein [Empedobacter]|uniref:Gliding motility protein GldL n=1 Tax=Empedobacter falsenii TaxID=343874 RepID=A0A7H9DQ30_9FLAO|nr:MULTISPECIES: hypothetical protein [Empedobacter]MDH2207580.1 hypothetical protein [Empedobacter sp. GD03644]QLL57282.1 hypothetical protein FH779_03930 [Empedobacter falsenii]